jgi:hypothetical protein
MGSPGPPPSAPENTVDAQDTVDAEVRGIGHKILLVKAAALGLVSLITLSQLGTGAKFGSGGPKWLLPVTLTLVILAAVMFGVAYRYMAFASAQLDARLTAGRLTPADKVPPDSKPLTPVDKVPSEIKRKSVIGWNLTLLGFGLTGLALFFYLLSVWWAPAAAAVPGGSPSSAKTPPSSTATAKQSLSTATPTPSPTLSPTPTPAVNVTVTPTVIVTVIINLPPTIWSPPTVSGRG